MTLLLQEHRRRTERGGLDELYPETGPLRRDLYVKHMNMLRMGRVAIERHCFGANRVGKSTSIGGYESSVHLTGMYPPWWEGHRFHKPITAWACGTTNEKVRDSVQKFLLGELDTVQGLTIPQGRLIPAGKIEKVVRRSGVRDALDYAIITHTSGWSNRLVFKSYETGRKAFEAEAIEWIWLDEEPPKPVYEECMLRILTTDGRLMSTMTPAEGMTEMVIGVLEDAEF